MLKLSRILLGIMLVRLVMPGATVASASQAGPEALTIDGDTAVRIGASTPDATVQVVAGTDGVYRREAGGDWRRTGASPVAGRIVFAASEPDLALNGDHARCLRGGESTPLSRTEDGGATWTVVEGVTDVRPLAIWADTGVVLGSSCDGFLISLDRGLTWSPIDGAEPGFEITAFAVVAEPSGTPVILFGETSEGGSSRLRRLDLADPGAPLVSGSLREYYGLAGLAASGDAYAIAAIDGVWISSNAGATWRRSAEGLEEVVLAEDPVEAGLPADVAMDEIGLFAIAFLAGPDDGLVVGTAKGVYARKSLDGAWHGVEGLQGRIDQVVITMGDDRLLLTSNDTVYEITLDAVMGGHRHALPVAV